MPLAGVHLTPRQMGAQVRGADLRQLHGRPVPLGKGVAAATEDVEAELALYHVPLLPFVPLMEDVRADDEAEIRRGSLRAQVSQGIYGVARRRQPPLDIRHRRGAQRSHCQARQREPVGEGRQRLAEGVLAAGDEEHLVDIAGAEHPGRAEQVTDVRRVERAAEHRHLDSSAGPRDPCVSSLGHGHGVAPQGCKREAMVVTGLEKLLADPRLVKGRRVGLLVNPVSVDRRLRHAADLALAGGWNLVRLFGPEHGVRGEAQDMEKVEQERDPLTLLPTVSLYGASEATLRPRPEQLEGIDVLVIDLQDIGARYYTYIWTAAFCAEVCGEVGVDVIVCDRPNPLGGVTVEGNVVTDGFDSFVGAYPAATRHAMTCGELVKLYAGDRCDLTVLTMDGWRRGMWYDQTGLPWVMPSPNMPTLDTATVYPGMCLLEGTNLSEARGTTRPFELFGAPWLDAVGLAARLDARALPGLAVRQVSFKPMFQKHAGHHCAGLQLHVTDREAFRSLQVAIAILLDVRALHPDEFAWREEAYEFVADKLAIDLLLGDPLVRHAIEDGADITEIMVAMAAARQGFLLARAQVLMYPE